MGAWREGLATYGRIAKEFPEAPARSPYTTNRTCGPLNGTPLMDFDLMDFTLTKLLAKCKTADEAVALRDEFVRLAPPWRTVRQYSLYLLAGALRRLGDARRAATLDAELGLCHAWVVAGPFDGPVKGADATAPPAQWAKVGRVAAVWQYFTGPTRAQAATPFGPEASAGKIDVSATYSLGPGAAGKTGWVVPTDAVLPKTWETPGAYYALSCVESVDSRKAHLSLAADGLAVAWLNGAKVMYSDVFDYPVIDQNIAPVTLRAGRNELLVKFIPWSRSYGQFVRITDSAGKPLPGAQYCRPALPVGKR